jgi:hypothetical protein
VGIFLLELETSTTNDPLDDTTP